MTVTFASPICSLRNFSSGSNTEPTAACTYADYRHVEKLAYKHATLQYFLQQLTITTVMCVLKLEIL